MCTWQKADGKRAVSKEAPSNERAADGTKPQVASAAGDASRPSSVNLNEMLSGVQNMFSAAPKSPSTTL